MQLFTGTAGTSTNFAISSIAAGSLLKTLSGGGGALGAAVSGTDFVAPATTITIAGTSNQITSSAGAQDLSTNRTWTLSLPALLNISRATTTEFSAGTAFFGRSATTTINGQGDLFVVGSTTLQSFTATNGTTTNATSTALYVSNSLQFDGELLPDGLTCANGEILKKTGANNWDCATDATGGGFAFPFTTQADWGTHNATSTILGFKAGFYSLASSTIGNNTTGSGLTIFGGATTTGQLLALGSTTLQLFTGTAGTTTNLASTNLSVTGITSSLLKTNTVGTLLAAIAGTDYLSSMTFSWPWTRQADGSHATSTLASFFGGIFTNASSTLASTTMTTLLATNGTTTNLAVTNALDVGLSTGTGDAVFQFAGDSNAWSMGYYSTDKTFRIASSTNLTANVYFQIGKSGTTTLNSGVGAVVGTDQSLCIDGTTFELTRQAGDTCAASSARYKHDIVPLGIEGLGLLRTFNPVSFVYNNDASSTVHWGFIAEEMASTSPQLAAFNDDGSAQTINLTGITSVLVKSMKELDLNLATIASNTASSTPASQSFAEKFFDNVFSRIRTWLASAANGIEKFFAKEVHTDTLCVKKSDGSEICVTGDQLATLLANSGGSYSVYSPPVSPSPTPEPTATATSTDTTATSTESVIPSSEEPSATTTPPVVEEPVPEPTPSPEPISEPVPEPEPEPASTETVSEPAPAEPTSSESIPTT